VKLLASVVVVSLAAHWAGFAAMAGPQRVAKKPAAMVEMTVLPQKQPEPPPAAKAMEEEAEPVAAAPVRRTAVRAARPAEAKKAAPPPPVDFTGTTLTGGSDGWASVVGNGETIAAPVAARPARSVVRDVGPARGPADNGVVALADLSRSPQAPDLNARLAENYPAAARTAGRAGVAVVRARIGADGRAQVLRVVSESGSGFGAACRATLDGSRWQAPLDRGGRPVATELSYTCRFQVGG
jgi:hypothetical protein